MSFRIFRAQCQRWPFRRTEVIPTSTAVEVFEIYGLLLILTRKREWRVVTDKKVKIQKTERSPQCHVVFGSHVQWIDSERKNNSGLLWKQPGFMFCFRQFCAYSDLIFSHSSYISVTHNSSMTRFNRSRYTIYQECTVLYIDLRHFRLA